MDTSETYIKMCDCPEIQDNKPTNGDRLAHYINDEVFNDILGHYWANIKYPCEVWLPRQDEIQEMMPENNCKCSCCLIFHLNKFVEENFEGMAEADVDSMEQYWLAFYMSEKHHKIWDGKKWIKSE